MSLIATLMSSVLGTIWRYMLYIIISASEVNFFTEVV